VRSQQNDDPELKTSRERPVAPESRRPFPEPVLQKHDRVTRITLVSDAFGGTGSGGSGATFF
jgi:hypothetical protein